MKSLKIGNVEVISDSNNSFFSPAFSKFEDCKELNSDFEIELDVKYDTSIEKNIDPKNLTFSTHTWDIYKNNNTYFFVLYLSESKKKINQALKVNLDEKKALFFYSDKRRKNIYHPLDRALFQLGFSRSKAIMFHGSAFEIDGQGFLAMGQSMSGKSTLARTLAKSSSRVKILNDEKNVIWKNNSGKYFISPTPWYGDMATINNNAIPLNSLLFLERLGKNNLRKITPSEALTDTVRNSFLPFWDTELLNNILDELEAMIMNRKKNLYYISFLLNNSSISIFDQLI